MLKNIVTLENSRPQVHFRWPHTVAVPETQCHSDQKVLSKEMADRFLENSLVNAIGTVIGNDSLGSILLVIAIVCFGVMYTIIRYSMINTGVGALTFVATRFILSTVLLVVLYLLLMQCGCSFQWNQIDWKEFVLWGSLTGFTLLCITIALQYSEITQTASQTSFILGMYVVMIPLVELALSNFTMVLPWRSWLAVAIDIPGIFLVSGCTSPDCFNDLHWGVLINIFAMLCTVANTILYGRGVGSVGVMPLLTFSFAFCAFFGTILALIIETEQWEYPYAQIRETWWLILAGGFLEFLIFVCMLVALTFTSTVRTSIVTSVESLSGSLFGYLLLGEVRVYSNIALELVISIIDTNCRRVCGWRHDVHCCVS